MLALNRMDLLEEMAKNVIEEALKKMLYHYQFPTGPVPRDIVSLMQKEASVTPLLPYGIVLMVRTKDQMSRVHTILDSVIQALESTHLIDMPRVRRLMVERESSMEEQVDLFIVALDD